MTLEHTARHPGVWYHVMSRRVGSELSPQKRQNVPVSVPMPCGVEVHAYCLMGTHHHLLLRMRPSDLAATMRAIEAAGEAPLGPSRVIPVMGGRHLAYVSRYIHLNPIAAGLVRRPEAWPHSSYRGYLDPVFTPEWLETSAILGWFGDVGGRRRYRLFVEQGLEDVPRDVFGRRRGAPPEEAARFREELRRRAALEPLRLDASQRDPSGR